MGKNNKYLSKLYNDLCINSLKTVSMNLPSDLGMESISQTTTKQGIVLSDWQMNYISDVNVQGINGEEYVHIFSHFKETPLHTSAE